MWAGQKQSVFLAQGSWATSSWHNHWGKWTPAPGQSFYHSVGEFKFQRGRFTFLNWGRAELPDKQPDKWHSIWKSAIPPEEIKLGSMTGQPMHKDRKFTAVSNTPEGETSSKRDEALKEVRGRNPQTAGRPESSSQPTTRHMNGRLASPRETLVKHFGFPCVSWRVLPSPLDASAQGEEQGTSCCHYSREMVGRTHAHSLSWPKWRKSFLDIRWSRPEPNGILGRHIGRHCFCAQGALATKWRGWGGGEQKLRTES